MSVLCNSDFKVCHLMNNAADPVFCLEHFHNTYELYMFIGGEGNYIVGDSIYHMEPYDLLIIPPTIFHQPKISPNVAYERFTINFPASAVQKTLLPFLRDSKTAIYHNVANDKLIKTVCSEFLDFTEKMPKEDAYYAIKNMLNLILFRLKHNDTKNGQAKIIHPTLSQILKYIDEHLTEKINILQLSKLFFVSPSWISHVFKQNLGISTTQYINNKKILFAQQLLQNGMPSTEAALQCGFDDYSTFYRQYKRYFGSAPSKDI